MQEIKKTKFPLIQLTILFIFFLGNLFTVLKSLVILLAILIYKKNNFKKYIDLNIILMTIFLLLYYIISQYDGQNKTEFNIQLLFVAPILYVAGKWLGEKSSHGIYLVRSIWLVGLSLASMSLVATFSSIIKDGFTGGIRSFTVSNTGLEISATVLAGLLVILVAYAGVTFSTSKELSKIERALIFTLLSLSLLAAARLGSRTILIIAIISIIQGIYINRKHLGLLKVFLLITSLLIFFSLALSYINSFVDIFSYYQDRLDNAEVGIASAGGRSEKWINSLSLIFTHPMGWGINLNGYSHNLWLDTARNGGIISFTLLVILSVRAFQSLRNAISNNKNDMAFKTTISCLGLSYFLLFSVEPILDGFIYVLSSFCCLWGITQSCRSKINFHESIISKVI